jgi:hypothetical protein
LPTDAPSAGNAVLLPTAEDENPVDPVAAPVPPSPSSDADLEEASTPASIGIAATIALTVVTMIGSAAAFVAVVWTFNPNPLAVQEAKPVERAGEHKPTDRESATPEKPGDGLSKPQPSDDRPKPAPAKFDPKSLDSKHRPAVVWLGLASKSGVASPIGTGFFVAKNAVATSADVALVLSVQTKKTKHRVVAFRKGAFLGASAIRVHPGFDRQDPAGSVNLGVLVLSPKSTSDAILAAAPDDARLAKPGDEWYALAYLEKKTTGEIDIANLLETTATLKLQGPVTGIDGVRGWRASGHFADPELASGAPALAADGRVFGVIVRSQRGPVTIVADFADYTRWPIVWQAGD